MQIRTGRAAMQPLLSRRSVLASLLATGATGLIDASPARAVTDTLLETTAVRLPQYIGGGYCWAAQYIAAELMRADGLTDVQFHQGDKTVDHAVWMANGETDFSINYPPNHIALIEAGVPIKVL